MEPDFDAAIVGSGPSGALAAARLVEGGARVVMLDVAHDDDHYRQMIPDLPFHELRRTDPEQRRYFLGDSLEGVPIGDVKVGAQLTPPRRFVTRDTERLLPIRGEEFEPMQSLALGGLGAAWGAACFTYTDSELERIGIGEPGFARHYDDVARLVGVSGEPADDASCHCFAGVTHCQEPMELDCAARSVWEAYLARRERFQQRGLSMGRTPLAVLSRDLGDRCANPYFDMDFWSDSRRSVFRPRYLVERLEKQPGFRLARDHLVTRFESEPNGVAVHCLRVSSGERVTVRARRMILCGGAINSARIALHSLRLFDTRVPILCNPYIYLPCFAWRRLGREAADRRHSLSQLIGIFEPGDAPDDVVSVQFYGYRSLLLFKLVKEMPLPPWAGLVVARLLVNSMVIAGLHHSDAPHDGKTMHLDPAGADGDALPALRFDYRPTDEEQRRRGRRERDLLRLLRRLGLIPYGRISPGAASSIHYAGTLPMCETQGEAFTTRPDGRLWHAPHVFAGDAAGWRFLPSKGLTYTIMANARRVAEHVLRDMGRAS